MWYRKHGTARLQCVTLDPGNSKTMAEHMATYVRWTRCYSDNHGQGTLGQCGSPKTLIWGHCPSSQRLRGLQLWCRPRDLPCLSQRPCRPSSLQWPMMARQLRHVKSKVRSRGSKADTNLSPWGSAERLACPAVLGFFSSGLNSSPPERATRSPGQPTATWMAGNWRSPSLC